MAYNFGSVRNIFYNLNKQTVQRGNVKGRYKLQLIKKEYVQLPTFLAFWRMSNEGLRVIGTYLITSGPPSAEAIFDLHDHHKKTCSPGPYMAITYGQKRGRYRGLMLPEDTRVMGTQISCTDVVRTIMCTSNVDISQ